MKYEEAIEYMESLSGDSIDHGLDHIRDLCNKLENPQKELSFIYVTGTKAKASVPAYIAAILKCAGYKVGLYIFSGIFEYRECIQINGRPMTKKAFSSCMERMKEICDAPVAEGCDHPTRFELETVMALAYFKEQGCHIVVLEADMGSRLEEIDLLGNTLTDIGEENRSLAKKIRYGLEKQRFDAGVLKNLEITLAGKDQIENALLAIKTVEALGEKGFAVSEKALRQGLKETAWPGCFSVVGKKPYFVVDGAQDGETALKLAESIELYFPNRRMIYIMSALRDEEYNKVIECTHSYADQILTVAVPGNPKSMSAYELATEVARIHPNVTAVDSLEEAVEISYLLAGKEDVILAFGSVSLVGRLIKVVENKKA